MPNENQQGYGPKRDLVPRASDWIKRTESDPQQERPYEPSHLNAPARDLRVAPQGPSETSRKEAQLVGITKQPRRGRKGQQCHYEREITKRPGKKPEQEHNQFPGYSEEQDPTTRPRHGPATLASEKGPHFRATRYDYEPCIQGNVEPL